MGCLFPCSRCSQSNEADLTWTMAQKVLKLQDKSLGEKKRRERLVLGKQATTHLLRGSMQELHSADLLVTDYFRPCLPICRNAALPLHLDLAFSILSFAKEISTVILVYNRMHNIPRRFSSLSDKISTKLNLFLSMSCDIWQLETFQLFRTRGKLESP